MSYLYIDIETLPTQNPDAIVEIAATVKPPASLKKVDSIAEWTAKERPAAIDEAVAKTSFNGGYGSVCVLSFAWDDEVVGCVDRRPVMEWTEAEMLQSAFDIIAHQAKSRASYQPVIVGHYVADFDLRFLWQRAFVLGVKMPAWWPRDPKPWSKEVHDTMQMWAGAKGTISLDNLCRALGIPGKDGFDGSMVAKAWANKEYDRVAEYCKDDVERVRAAHKKMLIAYGEV